MKGSILSTARTSAFAGALTLLLSLGGCTEPRDVSPPVKSALDGINALKDAQNDSAGAGGSTSAPKADAPTDVPTSGEFEVEFVTTAGKFTVRVNREWAPRGADRFYRLVKDGFYDDCGFFRVIPGFMVQFGIAGDPGMHSKWGNEIQDDPVVKSNQRGFITYAKTDAPNSRTTQLFINYGDNSRLDPDGFAPFGEVIGDGMSVVDKISSEHGEIREQNVIEAQGNAYLKANYPGLDYITTARVIVDDLETDEDTGDDESSPKED